ncbi:hypothetical protein ILYODFUR_029206 [Ilyodon furcidens]|uniref:Uncharacterized protein n=1 Tax=Ilyodon furcidens TaxID=33524 RepID=A0ABV0TMM3_9TELE
MCKLPLKNMGLCNSTIPLRHQGTASLSQRHTTAAPHIRDECGVLSWGVGWWLGVCRRVRPVWFKAAERRGSEPDLCGESETARMEPRWGGFLVSSRNCSF